MYSVKLNTFCLNTIQCNVKTISCQNTGSKVSGLLPAHARRKFSQISSELAVHLFLCLCRNQPNENMEVGDDLPENAALSVKNQKVFKRNLDKFKAKVLIKVYKERKKGVVASH